MLRYRLLLRYTGGIQRRHAPFSTSSGPTRSRSLSTIASTTAESDDNNASTSAKILKKEQEDEVEKKAKLNRGSLAKLFQFSEPEWSLIGASAATLVVTSSVTLLLPYASGQVIDLTMATTGDGDGNSPLTMAGGLFGLVSVSGIGVYLRTMWLARAGNRIVARLRQKAYHQMLVQDVEYLESVSTGDFLSRLSADSQLIQSAVTTQAVASLRAMVMSAGSASMLLFTAPTLAAVSLCTLPPIFVSARYVGRQLQEKQQLVQELQAQATSLAEQALNGVTTVKQFNGEGYESHQYSKSIAKAHRTAMETAHMQAQLETITNIAANGAVLGVLGYGGTLVLDGYMSAGDLTGFVMYSFLMAGNLSALSGVYADVSRAVAASDRVMEILERHPSTPPPRLGEASGENPLEPPEEWTTAAITKNEDPISVRIENLDFSYPSRPDMVILDKLNLSIESGKVLSLVGGSGSGKSTVGSLLTRLYEVPRNTIFINDRDLHDYSPDELRQDIGIVSQEPILFAGSIADNIRYGMWDASDEDVYKAAELAHVMDFTAGFRDGMDTLVGAKGAQLSGGQKQRVAIARVLLKNPPLVILDEATSALDARSEHLVQRAMSQIMESNKTVLSIAHRLSTIRHSDSIAVIQNGKVVEQGTFNELTKKTEGPFYKLMKTQLV
jgi:ABC-type multidrug transport system fused ATPase/permease subunit